MKVRVIISMESLIKIEIAPRVIIVIAKGTTRVGVDRGAPIKVRTRNTRIVGNGGVVTTPTGKIGGTERRSNIRKVVTTVKKIGDIRRNIGTNTEVGHVVGVTTNRAGIRTRVPKTRGTSQEGAPGLVPGPGGGPRGRGTVLPPALTVDTAVLAVRYL